MMVIKKSESDYMMHCLAPPCGDIAHDTKITETLSEFTSYPVIFYTNINIVAVLEGLQGTWTGPLPKTF